MTPHTNKCVHKNWPTDQLTKPPSPSCHSDDRREEDVLLNEVKNLVYIHVYIHISTPFMHPRSFTALRSVLDDKSSTPPFLSSWAKRRICLHPLTPFRSFTALRSVQDDKTTTPPAMSSWAKRRIWVHPPPPNSQTFRGFPSNIFLPRPKPRIPSKNAAPLGQLVSWSVGQFYIRRASQITQNFYRYI